MLPYLRRHGEEHSCQQCLARGTGGQSVFVNNPDGEQCPRAQTCHDGEHEAEGGAAKDGEPEDPLGTVPLGQEAAPDIVGRDEAHAVRREQSGLAASGIRTSRTRNPKNSMYSSFQDKIL